MGIVDQHDRNGATVLRTEHLYERRDEVGRAREAGREQVGEGAVGNRRRRLRRQHPDHRASGDGLRGEAGLADAGRAGDDATPVIDRSPDDRQFLGAPDEVGKRRSGGAHAESLRNQRAGDLVFGGE